MKINVDRSFLEINSISDLKRSKNPGSNFKISEVNPPDFHLNKFFYKQIGKDHFWRDRLVWTDKQWLKYSSNPLLNTWVLKTSDDELIGYYEIENHENKEFELINMGILSEYRSRGFGGLLLKHVLKQSKLANANKVWVHTCSLDHKFALENYLSKGFKIFKKEQIDFVA